MCNQSSDFVALYIKAGIDVVVPTMDDSTDWDKIKAAQDFWASFDLDGRRQKMDIVCLELKDGKEVRCLFDKQFLK